MQRYKALSPGVVHCHSPNRGSPLGDVLGNGCGEQSADNCAGIVWLLVSTRFEGGIRYQIR
jgi:hypothetical protein